MERIEAGINNECLSWRVVKREIVLLPALWGGVLGPFSLTHPQQKQQYCH